MRQFFEFCLRTVTAIVLLASWAGGESVQYCRFGHEDKPDATVNFCLGITTYYNVSSESHDIYTSMHVTRSSALGWTAVGTGSMMAGSLMFIIYGDPFSSEHEAPTVSIRTIDGHHQPRLVSQADVGGADLRLLQADWVPVNSTEADDHNVASKRDSLSVAKVAIVCYSCGKWPGAPISADATAQPWIWAWNDYQEFDNYTNDVHLKMHEHHAEDGGWGRFYVDMARSISGGSSPPPIPRILPGISALGVSDIPGGWSWLNPMVHIHGFLMSTAFLILYPAGVVAMRSGSPKSFKYHWIIQLLASIFVLIGGAIGLIRAHKIDSFHHFIGLTVIICSIVQISLGWRHHVIFLRIQRRQWASHGHIWLGRIFLLLGWMNVITGLLLTGHGWSVISLAASFISVIALVLVGWVWYATRQRKQREIRLDWEGENSPFALQPTRDDYFAVAADDDDEHDFRLSSDHSTPVKISKADME
ncbi:cytochrome and DOMON domain-containing protein [Aspergillus undulatus]|uniref:cytochrome and DOMON domain-containing protein n=1 Tax=Aspergillus undulatus TaxID=1810928 RepID=UPI003CCDAF99